MYFVQVLAFEDAFAKLLISLLTASMLLLRALGKLINKACSKLFLKKQKSPLKVSLEELNMSQIIDQIDSKLF